MVRLQKGYEAMRGASSNCGNCARSGVVWLYPERRLSIVWVGGLYGMHLYFELGENAVNGSSWKGWRVQNTTFHPERMGTHRPRVSSG